MGIQTDKDRAVEYLNHLKTQFAGTRVVGLADEVIILLAESQYAARIERNIIDIRGMAVNSHYITSRLYLTLRARIPFGSWSMSNYRAYAEHKLDDIVRGYKLQEKKA